jgi:hypothetical protein
MSDVSQCHLLADHLDRSRSHLMIYPLIEQKFHLIYEHCRTVKYEKDYVRVEGEEKIL